MAHGPSSRDQQGPQHSTAVKVGKRLVRLLEWSRMLDEMVDDEAPFEEEIDGVPDVVRDEAPRSHYG